MNALVNSVAATLSNGELAFVLGSVAAIGLEVWALIDLSRRPPAVLSGGRRMGWLVGLLGPDLVSLAPLGGLVAIAYLTLERPRLAARQRALADQGAGASAPGAASGPAAGPRTARPPAGALTGVAPNPGGAVPPVPIAPPPPAPHVPFGWYPDPSGQFKERWWDGVGWTGSVRS